MKSKNMLWLIELLFFLVAFYYVYRYYGGNQAAPAKTVPVSGANSVAVVNDAVNLRSAENSKLATAVVCLDIDEDAGKPLLAKGVFSRYIDRLYCFAEFDGAAPAEVVFYWIHKEAIAAQKRVRPSKDHLAAWCFMSMSPEKTGEWRVDIHTADGRLLGSTLFILK